MTQPHTALTDGGETALLTLCGDIFNAACRLEARLSAEPTAPLSAAGGSKVPRRRVLSIPNKRAPRAAAPSVP